MQLVRSGRPVVLVRLRLERAQQRTRTEAIDAETAIFVVSIGICSSFVLVELSSLDDTKDTRNISSIYFSMRRRFRDVSERGYFKSTGFSGTR